MSSKPYNLVYDPELKIARLDPSEYFMTLSAQQGIDELKTQIGTLSDELRQLQQAFIDDDLDIPETLEAMRKLILEIELVQQCIPYFRDLQSV